jgi:hypothetical protein
VAVLFVQAWMGERDDLTSMGTQRHGIAYVRALQSLIGAVVTAQSVAVAGGSVTLQPVDRAADAVAAADRRYGAELRTQVLWADVDKRIRRLGGGKPADAFASYNAVTALLLTLADKVGTTTGLTRGAHPETSALQDGAGRQLPAVIVAAGTYANLVVLASRGTAAPDAAAGAASASMTDQIADQRAAIGLDTTDLIDDIQNASDASPDAAISETTLSRLDQLRTQVDTLIADGATASTGNTPTQSPGRSVSVPRATGDAAIVQATAGVLAGSMLESVDGLVAGRVAATQRTRTVTIAVGILAVLLALTPLIWAAFRRRPLSTPAAADVPAPPRFAAAPRTPPPPPAESRPRFAEGGPLPRRRPAAAAVEPAAAGPGRELMPVGVMHHRRITPAGGRTTGTDIALASDEGRPGADR